MARKLTPRKLVAEDVFVSWLVWTDDKAGRSLRTHEETKMNGRFARRFREIASRTGRQPSECLGVKTKLDPRSAELLRRIEEEWSNVQPRF